MNPSEPAMTDSFLSRIPNLLDEQLGEYVRNPRSYRLEAVEAALAELARRGRPVSDEDLRRIRADLAQRDAAREGAPNPWIRRLLGTTTKRRQARVRLLTAGILVAGLGASGLIYATAKPKAPNPLGYEPEDTKKYLRDLELYGGKVNVMATEFMRWYDGLWRGPRLAGTVATLTVLSAFAFWFAAHPRSTEDLESGP